MVILATVEQSPWSFKNKKNPAYSWNRQDFEVTENTSLLLVIPYNDSLKKSYAPMYDDAPPKAARMSH